MPLVRKVRFYVFEDFIKYFSENFYFSFNKTLP